MTLTGKNALASNRQHAASLSQSEGIMPIEWTKMAVQDPDGALTFVSVGMMSVQ